MLELSPWSRVLGFHSEVSDHSQAPMWKWKQLGIVLLVTAMALVAVNHGLNTRLQQQGCFGEIFSRDGQRHFSSRTSRPQRQDHSSKVYHNWELFSLDYEEMVKSFKVYVYPFGNSDYSQVFLPHPDPYDRKLGNFFSEHMFKINLLNSTFATRDPGEAHLFFMPFSINAMRNHPRIRSEAMISSFVESYVEEISQRYKFWNRTEGVDHFYVGCHSVGRNAASNSRALQQNAIQVTCSANYYQKLYVPHKDVALPQVWPRPLDTFIVPPEKRTKLAFFSGRAQNSHLRETLLKLWSNDSDMDIFAGTMQGSYEDALSRSKFCLHVKGYEVNTARISDALHFGCVPVIISNQYDLPLSNVLNWRSFSIVLSYTQIPALKAKLQSVTHDEYARLWSNGRRVKRHFGWHHSPREYDSFQMTMYELWSKRHFVRAPL
ncbi:probable glycosyltransferase At3g07620 [Selaginella moellendorffii]|nr:probable glycosyltransferase At3g07620 [Selaginella moellendorffii]|eukprot:XP_002976961.2 probable glycosyltransferase At3g07620 [Selaginella moellendorffii]